MNAATHCAEVIMLVFRPPTGQALLFPPLIWQAPLIGQALIGIALLAAGAAAHIAVLDVLGCVGIASRLFFRWDPPRLFPWDPSRPSHGRG